MALFLARDRVEVDDSKGDKKPWYTLLRRPNVVFYYSEGRWIFYGSFF
jgi:hypothetical protein